MSLFPVGHFTVDGLSDEERETTQGLLDKLGLSRSQAFADLKVSHVKAVADSGQLNEKELELALLIVEALSEDAD